jgi:hypothetical protein
MKAVCHAEDWALALVILDILHARYWYPKALFLKVASAVGVQR